jgi:predicted nucleotidyltransferase
MAAAAGPANSRPLPAAPPAVQSSRMERPLTDYAFFRALCDLPFVEEIRLFGSRARGFARPRSDIDLALLAPGAGPVEWDRVREIAEEADTLLKVDIVRLDDLSAQSPLREAIEATGRVLYRRAGQGA